MPVGVPSCGESPVATQIAREVIVCLGLAIGQVDGFSTIGAGDEQGDAEA